MFQNGKFFPITYDSKDTGGKNINDNVGGKKTTAITAPELDRF